MIAVQRAPSRCLADHVAELWYFAGAPVHAVGHVLPAGALELIVDLGEDQIRIHHGARVERYAGAVVAGAYRAFFGTDVRAHGARVGVRFRPGRARPFLGAPPGEFADTHVDLSVLWGRCAVELRERLCEAATPARCFEVLEGALLERLARARRAEGHPGVPRAVAALEAGGVRVADVSAELGISHRRLIEVFTAEAGLGPKTFARIARFRHAVGRARRARALDWAEVAYAAGYCDQSHLIREFVAITGDAPTALFARPTGGVKDDHLVAADKAPSNSSKTRG